MGLAATFSEMLLLAQRRSIFRVGALVVGSLLFPSATGCQCYDEDAFTYIEVLDDGSAVSLDWMSEDAGRNWRIATESEKDRSYEEIRRDRVPEDSSVGNPSTIVDSVPVDAPIVEPDPGRACAAATCWEITDSHAIEEVTFAGRRIVYQNQQENQGSCADSRGPNSITIAGDVVLVANGRAGIVRHKPGGSWVEIKPMEQAPRPWKLTFWFVVQLTAALGIIGSIVILLLLAIRLGERGTGQRW